MPKTKRKPIKVGTRTKGKKIPVRGNRDKKKIKVARTRTAKVTYHRSCTNTCKDDDNTVTVEIEDNIGWRDYVLFGQLFAGIIGCSYKAFKWWRNRPPKPPINNPYRMPSMTPLYTPPLYNPPTYIQPTMVYSSMAYSPLVYSVGLGRLGII